MKRKMSYDPKCRDLADHFLDDEPKREGESMLEYHRRCDSLAQHIQTEIEAWLEHDPDNRPALKVTP